MSVTYRCGICTRAAAKLTLFRSGEPPDGYERFAFNEGKFAGYVTLVIEGAAGTITTHRIHKEGYATLTDTLAKAQSETPPGSGAVVTQSFSRACNAYYCAEHWRFMDAFEDFDDGDAASLDSTRGMCPYGHW